MKASKARRTQQPFVDVREPGKGKALLHVLADGRSTGHYKLNDRELTEVYQKFLSRLKACYAHTTYSIHQDAANTYDCQSACRCQKYGKRR